MTALSRVLSFRQSGSRRSSVPALALAAMLFVPGVGEATSDWEVVLPPLPGYAESVASACGRIFSAGRLGDFETGVPLVLAHRLGDGRLLWEDRLQTYGFGGTVEQVAASCDMVFVAASVHTNGAPCGTCVPPMEKVLRAYDARSGALRWEVRDSTAGGHWFKALSVLRGRLFASRGENRSYTTTAFDAATGTVLYQVPGELLGNLRGRVFLGSLDGPVAAHDEAGGALLWAESEAYGYVVASAVGSRHLVVVVQTNDGGALVRALEVREGRVSWERDYPPDSGARVGPGVAAAQRRVFLLGLGDEAVRALAESSGRVLWELAPTHGTEPIAIAASGPYVVLGGSRETATGDSFPFVLQGYRGRDGRVFLDDPGRPLSLDLRPHFLKALTIARGRAIGVGAIDGGFGVRTVRLRGRRSDRPSATGAGRLATPP